MTRQNATFPCHHNNDISDMRQFKFLSGDNCDTVTERVLVVLRDNRNVIGILRTCDQFNNLVLYDSIERIHIGRDYSEVPLGVFVVRGENVLLIGEMDAEKEAQVRKELKMIPAHIMLIRKRQLDDNEKTKAARKAQVLKSRGLSYHDED